MHWKLALAAMIGTATLGSARPAEAGDVSFGLRIVAGPPMEKVWVEPVYETRVERVWVEPVYETRIERVWVEPIVEQRCERIWVPDRFEIQDVYVRDSYGRSVRVRKEVLVERGHYEERGTPVVVRAGYWSEETRRVCVREGGWQTVERQVRVRDGGWSYEPARERVDFGIRIDRDAGHRDYNRGDRNTRARGDDADRFRDRRNDSAHDRHASADRGDRYRR